LIGNRDLQTKDFLGLGVSILLLTADYPPDSRPISFSIERLTHPLVEFLKT
jgi:hypothetical protein